MRSATFRAVLAAAFCAFLTSPALAAGVYTVTAVKADVTAASASEARAAGFDQAQKTAFDRLVKRLTLSDEVGRIGAPQMTATQLQTLVASVQIEEEHPVGAHYVGRLAVSFDPSGVRKALRDRGLTAVDTRSAPILVVPQFAGSADMGTQWLNAWTQGGFAEELIPVAVAPATLVGAPNWEAAAPFAAAGGATTALYANARIAGNSLVVEMVEVGANGVRRDRGSVSSPMTIGAEGIAGAFAAAADAANARIQNEWKVRLAAGAGQRARMTASAFYGSQGEWARIKRGLEGAGKTLISEISIEAVAKEGAQISFAYVGAKDQLAAELLRNGIVLADTPQGSTLRLAPGGA